MKAIKYWILITLLPVCFATAEDNGEKENWMREVIAKERARAEENKKIHSDTTRLEEKYSWAQEKHPQHVKAMLDSNKKAAEAWTGVLRKAEGATNPDVLSEAKQVANAASADVYLAEMTLRYAASAQERKNMLEKTRDRDVASLALKLDLNEKALLLANRAKNEAQAAAEKLQIENRNLSNELRKTFDETRKKDEGKDQGRDHDKELQEKERKRDPDDRPNHPEGGGGGVLGR
ncbi:MAG: hypothetical protein V4727_08185 [Verrucomicrobiota bacterium]